MISFVAVRKCHECSLSLKLIREFGQLAGITKIPHYKGVLEPRKHERAGQ